MATVALLICLMIVGIGALGIYSPNRLLALVRRFQTPAGLYLAAALRIVLGVALYQAAPTSRAPDVIGPLGVLVLAIGIVTPLFGVERFRRLLDWWSGLGSFVLRCWAAIALAFGAILAYAVAG
jgi:hypothetical protein